MASKEYRESHKEQIKESGREYYIKNKEKIRIIAKQYYIDNKETWSIRTRNNELKRQFGITLEQRNQMDQDQGGLCAICGNLETIIESRTGKVRELAVDHCHITGKTRSLLCMRCNTSFERYAKYSNQFQTYFEKHKD